MELKKLELSEKSINKDGTVFKFRYIGDPKKNKIDEENIRKLISRFMTQIQHYNVFKDIAFIRTILKDYDEQLFVLEYKENNKEEIIRYLFSTLYEYEMKETYEDESKNYKINYKLSDGSDTNKIEYTNVDIMSKKMSSFFNKIAMLNGIKPIIPNQNLNIIIEIYKIFYNEFPNFSDKNINKRIQAMMSILAEFGVCVNNYYSFVPYDNKEPMSLSLWQDIDEMFPVGEIKNIDDLIKIDTYYKDIIETAGEEIRNYINDYVNKDEILSNMSKLIYTANYNLSSLNDENLVNAIDRTEIEKDEALAGAKVIKKINSRLQKN